MQHTEELTGAVEETSPNLFDKVFPVVLTIGVSVVLLGIAAIIGALSWGGAVRVFRWAAGM